MIQDHLDIQAHVITAEQSALSLADQDEEAKLTGFHVINCASGKTDWDAGVTFMILDDDFSIYFIQVGMEGEDEVTPEHYGAPVMKEILTRLTVGVQAIGMRIGAWGHNELPDGSYDMWELRHQFLITPKGEYDAVTSSARHPETGETKEDITEKIWEFSRLSPGMVDLSEEIRRLIQNHNNHIEHGKDPEHG